jgi:2-keto-3-deoxy-L-rhamnonate aldolase RhmA
VNTQYALIGLLAAVPIAVIVVVLALRGYDVTLILRRKKKDE